MKFMDIYRHIKPITNMTESMQKSKHGYKVPANPEALKGKRKSFYGYAYYPIIKKVKGFTNRVAFFSDRQYEIVCGTYYRIKG